MRRVKDGESKAIWSLISALASTGARLVKFCCRRMFVRHPAHRWKPSVTVPETCRRPGLDPNLHHHPHPHPRASRLYASIPELLMSPETFGLKLLWLYTIIKWSFSWDFLSPAYVPGALRCLSCMMKFSALSLQFYLFFQMKFYKRNSRVGCH